MCLLFSAFLGNPVYSQGFLSNNTQLQEYVRRDQLFNHDDSVFNISFHLRALNSSFKNNERFYGLNNVGRKPYEGTENFGIGILPIIHRLYMNSNRPYGWADGPVIPNRGLQYFGTFGVYSKLLFFRIQFQPEIIIAQNLPFEGFSDAFNRDINRLRFRIFNFGDYPERFGSGKYTNFLWGQSKITAQFGGFETGISTQNIWWGPGQWNALTFSNNAPGFPHLSLNTIDPVHTFLGRFEGQLIVGRLESSRAEATQSKELNERFSLPFTNDWRYLNGITVSYNPKWISGLFLGFTRTYQQYNEYRRDEFRDHFPIFDAFQKTVVGFDRDIDGKDQQATIFARFLSVKAKAEIYFEYGRRDHAFNWREAILNPEHARAYLFGFKKLFDLNNLEKIIQVRGEMTHQQESVNRYMRYPGINGGLSWHTHSKARGFTHFGQPLGVGIGTGSNVQTLEISLVENFDKLGVLFERLANHQDFYYQAFGQQHEHQPWVDLSIGFLFDKKWEQFLLSSKLQLINGFNYQWQLSPDSTPEFPKGQHLFSVHSQVSLIYLFQKSAE